MTNSIITVEGSMMASHFVNLDNPPVCFRSGANDIIYKVYIDSVNDLVYQTSSDGGATWGGQVDIETTQTWVQVGVWFDQWTDGSDTGDVIHILATNSNLDTAVYFGLDTSDDSFVTNNDTTIVATVGAIEFTQGTPSICKGANDVLYVSWQVDTTNVGAHIYDSSDSGATWNSIYDRTEWSVDATADRDIVLLRPLSTDNDIIALFMDDSANTIYSIRYDVVGGGWDVTNTSVATGITQATNGAGKGSIYSAVTDPATGDVHLAYFVGVFTTAYDLYYKKYDESASTWGTATNPIIGQSTSATDQDEIAGFSICFDTVDSAIFIAFTIGEVAAVTRVNVKVSNDDGTTWSDMFRVNAVIDDIKGVDLPAVILDTANSLHPQWINDDLSDLDCVSGGLPLVRKTGNVVDNSDVAVSGATIEGFIRKLTSDWLSTQIIEAMGETTTDGSGNYTMVFMDARNDTPNFFVTGNDGSDATDQSRDFSS